jgi:hypothetical protein
MRVIEGCWMKITQGVTKVAQHASSARLDGGKVREDWIRRFAQRLSC